MVEIFTVCIGVYYIYIHGIASTFGFLVLLPGETSLREMNRDATKSHVQLHPNLEAQM